MRIQIRNSKPTEFFSQQGDYIFLAKSFWISYVLWFLICLLTGFFTPFAFSFYIYLSFWLIPFLLYLLFCTWKTLIEKWYKRSIWLIIISIISFIFWSYMSVTLLSYNIWIITIALSSLCIVSSILIWGYEVIKKLQKKYFLFSKPYDSTDKAIVEKDNTFHHQKFIWHSEIENTYYKAFVLSFLVRVYFAFLVVFWVLHFILFFSLIGTLYSWVNTQDMLYIYVCVIGLIYSVGIVFSGLYFFIEKSILKVFKVQKSILLSPFPNTYMKVREWVVIFSED